MSGVATEGTRAVSESTGTHVHNEGCLNCGLDYDFVMPDELPMTAHCGNLVVFAGAGVSTEVPAVFPATFYEEVRERLRLEGLQEDEDPSFPDLMQRYQDRHGRQALVRALKRRFNYVDSFLTLRWQARKFHRELATMPYLRDVVTTNWDTYFEAECLATPFVSGEDFAFHDMPGRRVYKIHGSMSNLSSIVLTESDYAARLDLLNTNVLGGALRQLLATKTVVFIGYSLRDWNFRRLYEALRGDMGQLAPRAYIVSPFESPVASELALGEIRTSGVKFLRQLKSLLVEDHFLPDEIYDEVGDLLDRALEAKEVVSKYSHKQFPALVHCWSYQEGLIDACGRILSRRRSGEYSDKNHVHRMCGNYLRMEENALEEGRYFDAAYIDGYINGLFYILARDEEGVQDKTPLYSIYGSDSEMLTEEELKEALEHSRRRAPKARAAARLIADTVPEGMVLNHGPFLRDVPSGEW